ncbi:MAG: DNA polymerase III subunit delta [Bacteroidota bacterium]
MDFENLKKDIEKGKFAPVYYLGGKEPYFVDKLSKALEKHALTPDQEAFNKAVLYGADAKAGKLLGEVRSFPSMMAPRRLVMLKEAQKFDKREWEKLVPYLENPVASTVFVMTFKGKELDQRTKAFKAIQKNGVVFKGKPVYDNQVGRWMQNYTKSKGYKLEPQTLPILTAYLGTNLGLIESELEKIFIYLNGDTSQPITPAIVYEMINIDKDYNVFELMNSLGVRDHSKSHFIVNQMMRNIKDNPPVLIVFQLFQFFSRILRVQSKKLRNEGEIGRELGIPSFVARQYAIAARNYTNRDLYRNLTYVLEADLFLKGVQGTHMSAEHVMKTLVYKVLN